jgi:hypothetical protein
VTTGIVRRLELSSPKGNMKTPSRWVRSEIDATLERNSSLSVPHAHHQDLSDGMDRVIHLQLALASSVRYASLP